MRKRLCSFVLFVLLLLLSASLVNAGGWAVVTLDQLPKDVVAGQPIAVTFTVRQHGRTLLGGLRPKITLINSEAGKSEVVNAKPISDALGKYETTLTFPLAGTWQWTIDAFGAFPQPMPPLTVVASAPVPRVESKPAVAPSPAVAIPSTVPVAVGVLGVGMSLALLMVGLRRSSRGAFALAIAAALVGLSGLALAALPSAPSQAEVAQAASAPSAADEATLNPMQYGHDLFLAKGCVVCHAHAVFAAERATAGLSDFTIGPVLTHTQLDAAYMHRWLQDPAAVKGPAVEMPTLGLSDAEIDALVVFLTTYKSK